MRIMAGLLLALAVMIVSSTAIEPVYLGVKSSADIIHLETGARHPGYRPHFEASGFAPPFHPQPMNLDPGDLVFQSEKLKNETESLMMECEAILNQTNTLALGVKADANETKALAEQAKDQAQVSAISAAEAKKHLNDTEILYLRTLHLSEEVKKTAEELETISRRINASINTSTEPDGYLKETTTLSNQTENADFKAGGFADITGRDPKHKRTIGLTITF